MKKINSIFIILMNHFITRYLIKGICIIIFFACFMFSFTRADFVSKAGNLWTYVTVFGGIGMGIGTIVVLMAGEPWSGDYERARQRLGYKK